MLQSSNIWRKKNISGFVTKKFRALNFWKALSKNLMFFRLLYTVGSYHRQSDRLTDSRVSSESLLHVYM